MIDGSADSQLLSKEFLVYYQGSRELNFDEFKKARNLLPSRRFELSDYRFAKNNAWLYAKIENRSQLTKWLLELRFSQLQYAQVYLTLQGTVIQSANSNAQSSNHINPRPSFTLNLPNNLPANTTLELYIYVKSGSMMLFAPIYLQTDVAHTNLSMLDFSLWGLYYGALVVLFCYAITFIVYKNKAVGLIYIVHLSAMLVFQLLFSGHYTYFFDLLINLFLHIHSQSLIIFICISATLLNLYLIPDNMHRPKIRKTLEQLLYVNLVCFFAFLVPSISSQLKLIVAYGLSTAVLILNGLMCVNAIINGYAPAKTLLFGWMSCAIGYCLSILFILDMLPNIPFYPHIFHFTLMLQTGVFLLAMVMRNQYNLELEVKQAENDALSNFDLIEEQNVHLDIARKEAVKASEVKSQFLANMSHEIRTPLNAIIGFSKELENNQNMLEREEHVRIINAAATDLLTIVNDILDFSKMEAGKLTLNAKPFCPRDLIEDIAALMAKTAHLKQLEFIMEVHKLPNSIVGDAFKVKQIVSNLLSNAIKFTNYGHIKLSVRLSQQNQQQCTIEFEVKDSGIGISQNDINKLFTAFAQLDDDLNRSFQGTGLGLIICQQLTHLMGGKITVNSEPAKGSTFVASISFPIDHSATQLEITGRFNGQKAYIVDDWDESHRAGILQLQALGFTPIGLQHVSALRNYHIGDDYVFVSFPFKDVDKRDDINQEIVNLHIANVVFMYSGPEPSKLKTDNALPDPKYIRMPLTTRKLEDIDASIHNKLEVPTNENIASLPAIRMLAVDDIELNLRLLQTWLKFSPITLDVAYDGPSAVELCQHNDYELILMDIQMPNMDGLKTTQLIRKTALNLGTPIVAVTAHAMEEEQQHFLDSGMDDFLPKPINLENLVSLINNWCEQTPLQPSSPITSPANAIDWDTALRLCYNDQHAAIEFLDDFTRRLHVHANEIENGWNQQSKDAVVASIHKLHGACCYTGVPHLKAYCDQAQTLLKTQQTQGLPNIIATLLLEIERVIIAWPKLRKSLA